MDSPGKTLDRRRDGLFTRVMSINARFDITDTHDSSIPVRPCAFSSSVTFDVSLWVRARSDTSKDTCFHPDVKYCKFSGA